MNQTTDQPPPQPASQPSSPRRLQRSRDDKLIAGVCGGIARHFGVDPVLVRIVVATTALLGGFGAVAYLAAWALVPEEGAEQPLLSRNGSRGVQLAGIAIVAFAATAMLSSWALAGVIFGGWTVVLVIGAAAAVWFWIERERPDGAAAAPPPAASAPVDQPATAATAATAPTAATAATAPTAATAATAATAPTAATVLLPADDDPTVVQPAGAAAPAAATPVSERCSGSVTAFATGAVLLVVGIFGALDAHGVVPLGWAGVVAVATVATGVALVASAFFGGARGLIPVGLLLAAVLTATAATGISLNGGIGQRGYAVADGDMLRGRYELAVGKLRLDVREIALARGTTRIDARVDFGMLEIVATDGRFAGGGSPWEHGGEGASGIDVRRTVIVGSGDRRLEIVAAVGAGAIVVRDRPDGPLRLALAGAPCDGGRDDA